MQQTVKCDPYTGKKIREQKLPVKEPRCKIYEQIIQMRHYNYIQITKGSNV